MAAAVVVLALLSLLFEGLGLVTALWGADPWRAIRSWWRRLVRLLLRRPSTRAVRDMDVAATGSVRQSMKVTRGPASSIEGRIARLETIAEDLDRRITEETQDLREWIPRIVALHADQVRSELVAATAVLGSELRITKLRAKAALALLIVGAICSAGANIVGA